MKQKDKLIILHALSRAKHHIEPSTELDQYMLDLGIEYIKLTEHEITREPEYKELLKSICELVNI